MSILDKIYGGSDKVGEFVSQPLLKEDSENGGYFVAQILTQDMINAAQKRKSFPYHVKQLFDHMLQKHTLSQQPQAGFENGMDVLWCRFRHGNLNVSLCVPAISGMQELVNDYALGRVIVTTSFDDLMKRAAGEV